MLRGQKPPWSSSINLSLESSWYVYGYLVCYILYIYLPNHWIVHSVAWQRRGMLVRMEWQTDFMIFSLTRKREPSTFSCATNTNDNIWLTKTGSSRTWSKEIWTQSETKYGLIIPIRLLWRLVCSLLRAHMKTRVWQSKIVFRIKIRVIFKSVLPVFAN